MSYFATPYTIHFDDTMAYGSHHFLTAFKFQCAARESLLYGDRIFDQPGVPQSLNTVHLFTADAYSRNLSPTFLGDRVAILITLEEWGRASARFCYRVLSQKGQPICAGFQTMICSDAKSGHPIPLPTPLRKAFDALREITEPESEMSFRHRVLAGTETTMQLFTEVDRLTAREYLSERYPHPRVISRASNGSLEVFRSPSDCGPNARTSKRGHTAIANQDRHEVWVFPGQGSFDADLLCDRVKQCTRLNGAVRQQLDEAAHIASQLIGGDVEAVVGESAQQCAQAVADTADLSQVAIYLQSILGAQIRQQQNQPALLMGHSFGEIAALSVAGCFDLPTGVRVVCERVRAIAEFAPPDGALLVATTNRQVTAEEIAVLGLHRVVVAGRNHEYQTVVSGPRAQLDQLRAHLKSKGIDAISISSPTCFHHPALRMAAEAWDRQLQQIPFKPVVCRVYSPIGRRLITNDDYLPTVLSSQLLRSFDLQGAIDDLVAGGFMNFVDGGSSGNLARLLKAAGPGTIKVESVPKSNTVASQPRNGHSTHSVSTNRSGDAAAQFMPRSRSAVKETLDVWRRPSIGIVAQGCLLPGRATSPAELHAAILQRRQGIFDQREMDPYWERDFYSASLVSDKSTSSLAGLVDDRDLVPPIGMDPSVFEEFSRAQKMLCVALAPCVPVLRQSGEVLCLMGTTADGFQDQDSISALRFANVDLTDRQNVERINAGQSVHQDPYAAVRQVFDRMVPPGFKLTLVDAACASSLYTVALGMRALENHEVDVVVAGGIFCPGPGNNCLFSQFGGLTATGCRPFDADADGVAFSEGAAIVVLRRLADAQQAGQQVATVIRGAGLSSDGRSPSANVPQKAGQLLALQRCYTGNHIDPATVVAIEGHGTATPVGDATELRTLYEFFSEHAQTPILLHSLKGLLGHTGWAAGTAALIAASEMLRTRMFPQQANHHRPSQALQDSRDILRVPSQAVPLRDHGRIAIDGLGFGGANAHIVIDSNSEIRPAANSPMSTRQAPSADGDLVVVAWHQLKPTNGSHFARDNVAQPEGVVLLPDLAEDMDITQSLALSVVGAALSQITVLDDALRSQTGIVLALSGKTERAVEASLRVLAPRLARDLQGLPAADRIEQAARMARPSGPYTLQCMMPNVAAGRAASQFNLNGPNFVVDAGANSLPAAFQSAGWLLSGGEESDTRLVVVAAIHANRWAVPNSDSAQSETEYAAAFAVTTRHQATRMGLDAIGPLASILSPSAGSRTTADKLAACVAALERISKPDSDRDSPKRDVACRGVDATAEPNRREVRLSSNQRPRRRDSPDCTASRCSQENGSLQPKPPTSRRIEDEFPIHTPVWIEAPRTLPPRQPKLPSERWLVLADAKEQSLTKLQKKLPEMCARHLVVLVGKSANIGALRTAPNVLGVDLADERSSASSLATIGGFAPNLILAVNDNMDWDFGKLLDHSSRHEFCELLFLSMKQFVSEIRRGEMEVWALFPGAWRKGVIHPLTGAASGLIKSAKREFPHARLGVLSHDDNSIDKAFSVLQLERSVERKDDHEVVYDGDRRLVNRLRVWNDDNTQSGAPRVPLDTNSVVVASGGARGVTAVLVESLLRDYGCTVVALGRSQLERGPASFDSPEVERDYYKRFIAENPEASAHEMKRSFAAASACWEAYETMDKLAQMDGRARYMAVDVTRRDEVDRAMASIVEEFGNIDLVVHGAGVQWSKKLEDRSLSEFRKTMAVKVIGLQNLVESCHSCLRRDVPVHVLTSAYSIFGNDGQHDYGAANETLDRLCGVTRLFPKRKWTSIAWSAWGGVGMTRGSEYRTLAAKRNLSLLDSEAGHRVFQAVLEGRTRSEVNVPLSLSERVRYEVRTIPPIIADPPSRTWEFPVFINELDCLAFHKTRGVATVPGAWIVDAMVNAVLATIHEPAPYITVEDTKFLRMVRIANEHDPNVRVILDAVPSGYHAWLIGNVISPKGVTLSTDAVFARATLSVQPEMSQPRPSLNGLLRNGHGSVRRANDPYCSGNPNVQLSGPFDCLPCIEIGPLGRRAIFSPHESTAWGGTIPALLLDAALRVAGVHVVPDALHVPTKVARIVLPTGMSTDSSAAAGWQIRTCCPIVRGDDIRCERVEVTDQNGDLQLFVEDALVSRLR